MAKGRPPAPNIIQNFSEVGAVENRSNRKYYTCRHCSDNQKLQHQDNILLNHLSSLSACPNAPPKIREQARRQLVEKTALLTGTAIVDNSGSMTQSGEDNDATVTRKKRRREANTLEQFVIQAQIPGQKAESDATLLW